MAKNSFIITGRFLFLAYAGSILWVVSGGLAFLYLAALVVLAILDFFRLPSASQLRIKKTYPQRFSLGKADSICTAIENQSSSMVKVELYNTLPASFGGMPPVQTIDLPPRDIVEVIDDAVPHERGEFILDNVLLICVGSLGLVKKTCSFSIDKRLKVYPEFRQLHESLNAKFGFLSSEQHRNPFNTREIGEFDSLRPYVPGESLRNIDWKASAKRSQLISKDWTEDLHKHVFLLIDCGQRMAEPMGHYTRLDHALKASVQLCHAAVEQKDSLSLMAFSNKIDAAMPETEKQDMLPRLLDALYKLKPKSVESDYWQVFGQALLQMNKRSLIILFSDLLDMSDSEGMLSNLAKASNEHLVLCVVMTNMRIQQTAASTPSTEGDWYSKGAACHMAIQRATVLEKMKNMGVKVLEIDAENFSLKVVETYLNLRKSV